MEEGRIVENNNIKFEWINERVLIRTTLIFYNCHPRMK